MLTFNKSLCLLHYLGDRYREKGRSISKKGVKVRQSLDSTFPHVGGFVCPHTIHHFHSLVPSDYHLQD